MKCQNCNDGRVKCPTCYGRRTTEKGRRLRDYCNVRSCDFERPWWRTCEVCDGSGEGEEVSSDQDL